MNCQQVHENIEGYYEGELSVSDELGIDIHLVQCPACNAELGDVHGIVHDCRDAFSHLPGTIDITGIERGIDELNQQVSDTEDDRNRFFRKELLLRMVLMGVLLPTLWMVGNKMVNTYNGYGTQYESTQEHYEQQETVPGFLDRDNVELDW